MPFVIGLTGGVGSGKSTAARIFESLGAQVVDADAISHQLTGPGGAAMVAIRSTFGETFLQRDGSLDRAHMRDLAFTDPAARGRLEEILHPLIRAETARLVAASTAPYVILVVPLLLEKGAYRDRIQRVLVIDSDPEVQIKRVMQRSRLSREAVASIMAAQMDRASRLAAADDVLDNTGAEDALRRQVERLHRRYMELASMRDSA